MRSLARVFSFVALASALFAVAPCSAEAAPKAKKAKTEAKASKTASAKKEKTPKGALSSGAPNQGKLYGAEKLESNRSLEVRGGGHAYGLPALVKALKRAASKVNKKFKGSVLYVGDLSAKKGGALLGHNSHQSGRDADVGFYMQSPQGKHVNPHRFVAFASDGRPRGTEVVHFDDERNWAFIEALLSDDKVDVRYLFVSMGLRSRLLKFAAKKNVSKDLQTKAAAALMSPADVDVHDDHFHVRIACPEKMRPTCVEESFVRAGAPAAVVAKVENETATKDASVLPAAEAAAVKGADEKTPPAAKNDANEPRPSTP